MKFDQKMLIEKIIEDALGRRCPARYGVEKDYTDQCMPSKVVCTECFREALGQVLVEEEKK